MTRFWLACALLAVAGCSGKAGSHAAATQAPGSAASPPAIAALPSPVPMPAASGIPTPYPDTNLLSTANGTILRSYAPPELDGMNDGNLGNAALGIGTELPSGARPPFVFTFELPTVEKITSFTATLRSPAEESAPPSSVTIAVSTTDAEDGFKNVGTLTATASDYEKTLNVNVTARWVRVTANELFDSVSAQGSVPKPPPTMNLSGIYIEQGVPDAGGSFVPAGTRPDVYHARFTVNGAGLTATECSDTSLRAVYAGDVQGRTWTATFYGNKDANPTTIHAVANDDGSIVAGVDGSNSSVVFVRSTATPAPVWCGPRTSGSGPHRVLVLDQDPQPAFYPADADTPLAGYTFDAIGAGMLDSSMLANHEAVISRGVCRMNQLLAPEQLAVLLQWAASAGHKTIFGGGWCTNGTDFTWLPYPFSASESGPQSTNASLIAVENNALGTNDASDAQHFVDTAAYAKDSSNDLASSFPVSTADSHWCGHFFVVKTTNLSGLVQTYAVDGAGLLVYDGFNPGDQGNAQLQKIRQLELALPVPSSLPCTQLANQQFFIAPSQQATFQVGSAQTLHAAMDVLANQGYIGHVTVATDGPVPSTVTPASFDISGGVVHLDIAAAVPATASAGAATIGVTATSGGKSARAVYTLTGIAPGKAGTPAPRVTTSPR